MPDTKIVVIAIAEIEEVLFLIIGEHSSVRVNGDAAITDWSAGDFHLV